MYTISIDDTDIRFSCSDSQNVLAAMEKLGIQGIPVGCRGGGCGICRVSVLRGEYHTQKMSRAQVSEQDEKSGIALACKLIPEADLMLKPLGLLQKQLADAAKYIK